ncbi:MAG: DUF99 family protein [Desulfurococcales archaeon]|nr:DUF99 family protein [Desulfurococcales archaeon]
MACDDGVVAKLGGGYTLVSCVYWALGVGPLGADFAWVKVDGLDASSIIAYLASRLGRFGPVDLVMLDSVTIAGFNVASPASIHRLTGAPVVVLYKYSPSLERLASAVVNVDMHRVRLRVLKIVGDAVELRTRRGRLYAIVWGASLDRIVSVVEELQFFGRMPEPLRLAHYLASAISSILNLGSGECFNSEET